MSGVLDVVDLQVATRDLDRLRRVSFSLDDGERLGIVGESGSGKSLTALSIMQLLDGAARVTGGTISLAGSSLTGMPRRRLNGIRGRRMAMVYQDPGAALNPLMTIGAQLVETIRLHSRGVSRAAATAQSAALLDEVGIPDADRMLAAYPHELSGGMRQRAMIAMALSCDPEVLICDEPTTALDVTTQARVMALLDRMSRERGAAVVLITHDLGVVAGFCDRVAVMYAGQIVEVAPTEQLFRDPRHPYTRALLEASLDLETPQGVRLPSIPGSPRAPRDFDDGCAFRDRCPLAIAACAEGPIALAPTGTRSSARCIRLDEEVRA